MKPPSAKSVQQVALSNLTPTQLGESNDSRAIPILHNYLKNGPQHHRTWAASAIRKLSYSFKRECSTTIDSLLECAACGNQKKGSQLRQYSLLALERLDLSLKLESWFKQRLASESDHNIRQVILRILASLEKKKVVEFMPERVQYLNTFLSRCSLLSFWHISHVDNLWSLCRYGILNHSDAHAKRPTLQDISDPSVQRWRTREDPIYHRPIHDYAPLYINPRNPMLYKRKDIKKELCLVEICPTIILSQQYLLTDGNAASATTSFYQDYCQIEKLPWSVLNGTFWNDEPDGKRKMCSEVLIFPVVWPAYIKALHVYEMGEYHPEVANGFPIICSPNLFFN